MERIRDIIERFAWKLLGFETGGIVAHHTGESLEQELRRRIAIQKSEQERIYFEGYDDDYT